MSNTAFLRDRGWRGLCIDGNPVYAPDWDGRPEFICAVLSGGEMEKFEYRQHVGHSRIGAAGKEVQTRRLEEFLVNAPAIDFISCDLEGHEFAVLSTLDWNRHRPQVVISEFNTAGLPPDFRVRDMMEKLGYRAALQNAANFIFTPCEN